MDFRIMKKGLIMIFVLASIISYAQNNIYGKKVVGLDSLVSDTIRAYSQSDVYLPSVQIEDINIDGNDLLSGTGTIDVASNLFVTGAFQTVFDSNNKTNFQTDSEGVLGITGSSSAGKSGWIEINNGGLAISADTNFSTNKNAFVFDADISITGGNIYLDNAVNIISANSVDGSDDDLVNIAGGGTSDRTRGGFINLYGNEVTSSEGDVRIIAGDDAASGEVEIWGGGNGTVDLLVDYNGNFSVNNISNLATEDILDISSDTTITFDADSTIFNTGDVVISEDAKITGNLDVSGIITNPSTGRIELNDLVDLNSNILAAVGSSNVTGSFFATSTWDCETTTGNTTDNGSYYIRLNNLVIAVCNCSTDATTGGNFGFSGLPFGVGTNGGGFYLYQDTGSDLGTLYTTTSDLVIPYDYSGAQVSRTTFASHTIRFVVIYETDEF